MKKKIIITALSIFTVMAVFTAGVFAAGSGLTLIVNGKISNAETKIIDGSTYVPLRAAAEMLGADVKYEASTRTVTIVGKDASANLASNLKTFKVNVNVTSGPMKLNVSQVTFDPAYQEYEYATETQPAIILDVTVENTSDEKLTWFVDHSELVLNTKEQIERTLLSDDWIKSDFNGMVIKKRKIAFPLSNSEFKDIKSMRLLLSYVSDASYDIISEEKEVEIILP
ncbi:stalk domain-containing protein [Marinicrinis sediminis]|uniref:Stalk domain-containing protein n=1 Tax=Marinicrinis sediminis TaxID=1652465 RepID=A0ABW5R9K7_9BACL